MKTIVCHGDSLTEGSDLNQNYTWPRLVGNRLNVEDGLHPNKKGHYRIAEKAIEHLQKIFYFS